jgi:hypothetical protein
MEPCRGGEDEALEAREQGGGSKDQSKPPPSQIEARSTFFSDVRGGKVTHAKKSSKPKRGPYPRNRTKRGSALKPGASCRLTNEAVAHAHTCAHMRRASHSETYSSAFFPQFFTVFQPSAPSEPAEYSHPSRCCDYPAVFAIMFIARRAFGRFFMTLMTCYLLSVCASARVPMYRVASVCSWRRLLCVLVAMYGLAER